MDEDVREVSGVVVRGSPWGSLMARGEVVVNRMEALK